MICKNVTLILLLLGALAFAQAVHAGGEGEGEADRDGVVSDFLVAAHAGGDVRRRTGTRARRPRRKPLRLTPGSRLETALLLPRGVSLESGVSRRPSRAADRVSCVFGAKPCVCTHRSLSIAYGVIRRGVAPAAGRAERQMFETLANVAPSARDKEVLKRMMVRDRAAGSRLPPARLPTDSAAPLWDDPMHADGNAGQMYGPLHRPAKGFERLLGRFAENLYKENNRRLAPIGLEAQLFRINARLAHPGHEDNFVETQRFLEAYLERRGRRALYNAVIDTVRSTALVNDTYRRAMAFRNRYLNFSASYGGYDRGTVRDDIENSAFELAEQNEQQFGVDETIEEELALRRVGVMERLLNPFKKGRVSLRASVSDWVELIWKTPNFELRAAPKKARLRLGGQVSGLDISSYAVTRYRGWRGRSGLEVVRPIDERTRLKLAAGVNFGRDEDQPTADLADVFSLTNDPSYIYLSFERSF